MGIVAAIGGFGKKIDDVRNICERIVRLSKKNKPSLLYIPTANDDHVEYTKYMTDFFEDNYDCDVSVLRLLGKKDGIEEIDRKIMEADIVFVEGGNLIKLLDTWRENKIDEKLRRAYLDGTIMSGVSAGAICWFEYAYSDSVENDKYDFVEGLGIVKGSICPHYKNEERKRRFNREIREKKNITEPIYMIEDNNAVVIDDYGVIFLAEHENTRCGVHMIRQKEREESREREI